jgi:hypothetical protein
VEIKTEEPDCDEVKQNLSIDVAIESPGESSIFDCNICGKKFLTKNGLVVHKGKMHASHERQLKHGQIPFAEMVQLHLVLKNGEEERKCSVCSVKFNNEEYVDEIIDEIVFLDF